MKKKLLSVASFMLAVFLLASCGQKNDVHGSSADYKTVIENARPSELNGIDMYGIATAEGDVTYSMVFHESTGFVEDDMEKYAISIGSVITLAYGVAIILPKEGREQAVIDQLKNYVEVQKRAQENYLPLQYEIAKNALVETVPTGEVVLVMCENSSDVMAAIKEGLKAS